MKVRMTLELPDGAREYIAQMTANTKQTTQGLATRQACQSFFQHFAQRLSADQEAFIAQLNKARAEVHFGPLHDSDIKDSNEAVDYLRAQGKTDAAIRQWLLKQRARSAIQYERIVFGRQNKPMDQPHHGHES